MQPEAYGKVVVLMGGNSAERDISLQSGQAVLSALQRCGVDARAIDTQVQLVQQLQDAQADRALIALHGRGGEDGTVQGLLELLELPYTGSGVLGSALAMDKWRTKQIWQSLRLPTPPALVVDAHSDWRAVAETLALPLIIKPALEGSSVGISKVTEVEDLPKAFEVADECASQVLAEGYIRGAEYTVAVLQDKALPLVKLETPRDFYDFAAKYEDDRTAYICPSGLPEAQEKALQDLALQAFRAIGARGWGRVDFILDTEGQPWLLEVNTVPGMTSHSLVPMAAKAAGMDFDSLVLAILQTAEH